MPEQHKQPSSSAVSAAAAAREYPRKNRASRKKRAKRRESMPLLLKITLVPFLLFIALLAGLITGYSILGDGNAFEVFDIKTWKHMYDLVFG